MPLHPRCHVGPYSVCKPHLIHSDVPSRVVSAPAVYAAASRSKQAARWSSHDQSLIFQPVGMRGAWLLNAPGFATLWDGSKLSWHLKIFEENINKSQMSFCIAIVHSTRKPKAQVMSCLGESFMSKLTAAYPPRIKVRATRVLAPKRSSTEKILETSTVFINSESSSTCSSALNHLSVHLLYPSPLPLPD